MAAAASDIAKLVSRSTPAASETKSTAVNDCIIAAAKLKPIPRPILRSRATRYDEITTLPCPGPAA